MKTNFISSRLLLIVATLTLGFMSCNKDNLSDVSDEESVASQGLSIAAVEDGNTMLMADQAEANGSVSNMRVAPINDGSNSDILGDCAVITRDTMSSPKKIIIDFGTGCTSHNGVTRKGKIIITYNGGYREIGTVIHVQTEDYYVNDNKVEINKTVKNLGPNENGNLTFEVNSTRVVTFPNGKFTSSTAVKQREWLHGANTPLDFSDDVFRVNTQGVHTSRNGVIYTFHSLTDLIRKVSCHEFVSGELKVVRKDDADRYFIINFGTGDCDDEATVTLDNGRSFTIDLRH